MYLVGDEEREELGKENKVTWSMDVESEMRLYWNLTTENVKVQFPKRKIAILESNFSSSQSPTQAGFPSWIVLPGYIKSVGMCYEKVNYKLVLDFSVGNTKHLIENAYFKIVVWTIRFLLQKQTAQPDAEGLPERKAPRTEFHSQPQFRQGDLSRPQPRDHSTLLWWHYFHYASNYCSCWILFHKTGYDLCNSFYLYPYVEESIHIPARLSRQQLQLAVIMVGNEITSHICNFVHFAVDTRFCIIICESI